LGWKHSGHGRHRACWSLRRSPGKTASRVAGHGHCPRLVWAVQKSSQQKQEARCERPDLIPQIRA
jgi:hypothetical protein